MSLDVVQLLAQHKDPEINAKIARHWPDLRAKTSEENQAEIARVKKILQGAPGNPDAGRLHFQQRCLACHNAALAPKRIQFHEPQLIEQHAAEIYQQVVVQKSMPLNNATGITDEERATLGRWFKER